MLKRYWTYLIIILAIISFFLLVKLNSDYRLNKNNKFEIKTPSLITGIYLADRNGNTITLQKRKEAWTVNNKFLVRQDAINTLLLTANKIRVKKPVSKAAYDNVMKYIATTGVTVEFFKGEKKIKSYTIGSNTPDHLGTYMLLKDRKKPAVVHIPSFNGFLSPRYGIQANSLDIASWRSNTVFNINAKDIDHIKYTDYTNSQNSYLLKTNPFKLIDSKNQSIDINKRNALKLINSFSNLNCETFKKEKEIIDSLSPLEELIINFDTLVTYPISETHNKDQKENFTVKRKYATINNGDLMLIQDYVFNKVLININELKD